MRSLTRYAQEIVRYLPSPIYKVFAQKWIDYRFPRHLFIETTTACNLRCGYCPREKESVHMEWSLFQKIIDEASQYGPRSFSLHLFGEPLLYPKFTEAVYYIKKKNGKNTILLTTNGTSIDRYALFIIESMVDEVIWTWRKEAEIPDFIVRRMGRRFRARFLNGTYPKGEPDRWRNLGAKVEVKDLHNYGGNVKLRGSAQNMEDLRYPCYHPWLAPAVSARGEILICCADPRRRMVVGNMNQQSFSSVWQSDLMHRIRKSLMIGKDLPNLCKECDVWRTYPDLWFKFQKR